MPRAPHILPPLPPQLDLTPLVSLLTGAHFALGELNGMLATVPNVDLLTAPLLTKEAVLSSKIEGTVATLEEVLVYEAEQSTAQITERDKDIREILNYRKAIRTSVRSLDKAGLTSALLLKLQDQLLDSVRGAAKQRGQLRSAQVYIGAPGSTIDAATYVPPAPKALPQLLRNWEKFVNDERVDPLIQAALAHYQFEAIHPFMDGNGRTGRLIIPLSLYQRGLLSYPILYMSEYLETRRSAYYQLLRGVTEDQAWDAWLRFFITGIQAQSLQTQQTVDAMLRLYHRLKDEATGFRSAYAVPLLDLLFRNPTVSYPMIRESLRTGGHQTVYNLLKKFVRAGIIKELPGRKRNRMYIFPELLKIVRDGRV